MYVPAIEVPHFGFVSSSCSGFGDWSGDREAFRELPVLTNEGLVARTDSRIDFGGTQPGQVCMWDAPQISFVASCYGV